MKKTIRVKRPDVPADWKKHLTTQGLIKELAAEISALDNRIAEHEIQITAYKGSKQELSILKESLERFCAGSIRPMPNEPNAPEVRPKAETVEKVTVKPGKQKKINAVATRSATDKDYDVVLSRLGSLKPKTTEYNRVRDELCRELDLSRKQVASVLRHARSASTKNRAIIESAIVK
ncbi:MAG TPA: hypothetical protein VFK07_03635 [Candidatus Paceibacterota bacterium]|nr:hypothetical protein [Candidatus Paceibacterota bacterium]